MRIIIIAIILGSLYSKSGRDVIEITRLNWCRMELTALYGGYSLGEEKMFINFHSTTYPDVIEVVIYFSHGVGDHYKDTWMKYIRKTMEISRENMRAEDWLSFTYRIVDWEKK